MRTNVPYRTSSGIQIGVAYEPPPAPMRAEDIQWQSALLRKPSHRVPNLWPLLFGVVCFVLMSFLAVKK